MANTILERIQERYPGVADDARNIAEAMAMVCGTGGRGAGAIADNVWKIITSYFLPGDGTGAAFARQSAVINPVDLSDPPERKFTPPTGKVFAGWGLNTAPEVKIESPYYTETNPTFVAIWVDVFTITFDANSGSGTIEPIEAVDGTTITLPDGSDLTAPAGKEFVGWGESALATEPVDDPYTVTDDAILYAIWDDVSAGE